MIKNISRKKFILSISLLLGILLISSVSAWDWCDWNCDLCEFDWGCSHCCDPSTETCDNGNHCCECEEPECCTNDDCEEDYNTENYCMGNDIYYDSHNFFCEDGECEEEIFTHYVDTCEYDCVDGSCIDEPPECCDDNDCLGGYSEYFCENNNIIRESHDFLCEDGECVEHIDSWIDEECGEDVYGDWNHYCIGKEIWKDRTNYLKGCSDASCYFNEDYENEYVDVCEYDCINGECINSPEPVCGNLVLEQGEECDDGNLIDGDGCSALCKIEELPPPECCDDEDCNDDYYSDKYCSNGDVYYDFHDFFCELGICNGNITKILFEECEDDEDCEDGECVEEDDNDGHRKRNKCCYDYQCGEEDVYYTYQECDIEFGRYNEDETSYYSQDLSLGDNSNDNSQTTLLEPKKLSISQESKSNKSSNFWIYLILISVLGLILLIIIFLY